MAELLKQIKLRPNTSAAIIIAIFGLAIHTPFLFFGLTSDHLLAIYEWRGRFLVPSVASFQAFINPYGASAILTRTIDVIWGDNPFVFFFTAIIFKILAAYTLYLLSKHILKSNSLSILIGTAAVVAFSGIQGVAPGGTVHISLALFNLGLLMSLKNSEKKISRELFSFILHVASFAITPTRMYPIFLIVILVDLSRIVTTKSGARQLLFKLVAFAVSYQVLKEAGLIDSYGTAAGVASTLTSVDYYKEFTKFISIGIFSLASVAQVLIPDQILGVLSKALFAISGTSQLVLTSILQAISIAGFILFVYKTKIAKWSLLLAITALTIVTSSFTTSLAVVPTSHKVNVFLGAVILCGVLALSKRGWKDEKYHLLLILTISPIAFLAAPYLLYQFGEQETLSRYFSAASLYGPLILVLLLTQLKIKKSYIYSLIALFIALNSVSSLQYQHSAGSDGTYQFYLNRVFGKMNEEIGPRRGKPRPLVFVRGDNGNFLSTTVTNLGDVRFSLYHKNLSENQRPIFVTDKVKLKEKFDEMLPLSKGDEFVYGFEIKNKQIYSITNQVRDYLYLNSDQF